MDLFVSLFGLMLYVHGQQLRSCRDGQLAYPHCSWASLPEAGNQYLAHTLSSLTDNCSSLFDLDHCLVMLLTLKKLKGHIAFGLSMRSSLLASVTVFYAYCNF